MKPSLAPLEDPRGFAPYPTSRVFRDRILPRAVVPFAWLFLVALLPAWALGRSQRRRNRTRSPIVAIESGRIGWTQVFFEELAGSAEDYFGKGAVVRAQIDREQSYGPQFKNWITNLNPTHVILDVRTPPQSWAGSVRYAFSVSWTLHRRGVYPVVIMTDAFHRRQRWHASVLTAWSGMVITYAARSLVRKIFPHSRMLGPQVMTVSRERILKLKQQSELGPSRFGPECIISFVGNVYPPRSQFLEALSRALSDRCLSLVVHGDKGGRSNEDYWETLANADIIVTTTMQGPDRNYIDWNWIRQAVHRYSETFAAGTALVAAPVDGGFPDFKAGHDYLEFESVVNAADAIERLANNPNERDSLARHGHETFLRLMDKGTFWKRALGQEDPIP